MIAIAILSIPGSPIKPNYPMETFEYDCACGTRASTFFTVHDVLDAVRVHVERVHPLGWEDAVWGNQQPRPG